MPQTSDIGQQLLSTWKWSDGLHSHVLFICILCEEAVANRRVAWQKHGQQVNARSIAKVSTLEPIPLRPKLGPVSKDTNLMFAEKRWGTTGRAGSSAGCATCRAKHDNERAVNIPHQRQIKQFCPQQIMCLCLNGFLLCCFNDASSFLQHPAHLVSMMGADSGRVPPLNGDPALVLCIQSCP